MIHSKLLRECENMLFTTGSKSISWIANQSKCFFHCEFGPAFELSSGHREWIVNGTLHRTDGPAIEQSDGTCEWYVNGKRHRTDGPAVENANGDKHWCVNGELHRTDGPAIEKANGTYLWYLNGVEYSFAEWCKLNPLSDRVHLLVAIEYADGIEDEKQREHRIERTRELQRLLRETNDTL